MATSPTLNQPDALQYSRTVQYPHPSSESQPGAVIAFPDSLSDVQFADAAKSSWQQLLTEDSGAVNALLDEHIKATHHLMVRTLRHLHTQVGLWDSQKLPKPVTAPSETPAQRGPTLTS
jgi:hypothetical protein